MQAVVCVKPVRGELSPFDAAAVESALRLREKQPDTAVTVVSMGRPDTAEPLRRLTRLGISRAILLSDSAFAGADTLATAYTLSLAMKKLQPDLILCGRQSIDGDTAQTGPALAALLGWPVLTHVLAWRLEGKRALCTTRFGEEAATLPALLTVERLYPLRFPRLGSKAGAVETWTAEALGADPVRCGLRGSPTRVLRSYEAKLDRRQCRFAAPKDLDTIIREALEKPRMEWTAYPCPHPLPAVWYVGETPPALVRRCADRVITVPRSAPEQLAERFRRENPPVVLWPADLWGRRTAPQVAAMLRTGLCADCTGLETDGQHVTMIRPAMGGGVLAAIACRTRPTMATVREEGQRDGVTVAVGAGAAASLPAIRAWALNRGYALAASRALVDRGMAPYTSQVGLTGKTVRPQVYVAIGISGAVQHTCAIEGAGTVIAINPDRNARIFDCADVGICADAEDLTLE